MFANTLSRVHIRTYAAAAAAPGPGPSCAVSPLGPVSPRHHDTTTGAGWGQSGYVGGEGPWAVSATEYTNHFVIYERLPHGIDLRCNYTRPHRTRSGSGRSCASTSRLRALPARDAKAGPPDFLFTAAADYLSVVFRLGWPKRSI
jgi:hypothetical protein